MHCLVLKQESIVLTLIAAFLALLKWKNADAGFVYSKDEEFCSQFSCVLSHALSIYFDGEWFREGESMLIRG